LLIAGKTAKRLLLAKKYGLGYYKTMKKLYRTTFLLVLLFPLLFSAGQFSGKCVRVGDGDTIEVMRHGKAVRVRLFGIDAPELKQDHGRTARKFLAERIAGKEVRVRIMEIDQYGRVVGKVYLGDTYINLEIIRAGYAWWYSRYAPNDLDLMTVEKKARAARIGLWSHPRPSRPWKWRQSHRRQD